MSKPKDDLISRNAAIEELMDWVDHEHEMIHWAGIKAMLECLPSAGTASAQPSRVVALEEIQMREVYWAERKNVTQPWPIAMHHIRNVGPLNEPVYQDYMGDDFNTKEYGKIWRCWTSYPTDEQRKAASWSEQDQREYEAAVEMAEYCECYESTYNADDGSM